jgi:hypothetical protein
VHVAAIVLGIVVIAVVVWDAFETVLLPRRVSRRLRLSSIFLEGLWLAWTFIGRRIGALGRSAENYLSLYAMLALLMLFALWVSAVAVGYALIDYGLGHAYSPHIGVAGFGQDLYVSGTTIFTLGLGDIVPIIPWARAVTVLEAGTGLTFLALVIAYLPVLYQSFSRRELEIALLDEWAGTPPTGVDLLRRAARDGSLEDLTDFFHGWEHWAADILESHVSFPILGYFRSQHDNQSWLAAMTAVLDASALCMVGVAGVKVAPARRAFAMNRHAAVDLSQVLGAAPHLPEPGRGLDHAAAADTHDGAKGGESGSSDGRTGVTLRDLRNLLRAAGIGIEVHAVNERRFASMRRAYEPYVEALSVRLMMPLPPLLMTEAPGDNWLSSPWEVRSAP